MIILSFCFFLLFLILYFFFFFFFFFQAEDGIRDRNVTGVQTCALPICRNSRSARQCHAANGRQCERADCVPHLSAYRPRSEERRVGKECRSRWSPEH